MKARLIVYCSIFLLLLACDNSEKYDIGTYQHVNSQFVAHPFSTNKTIAGKDSFYVYFSRGNVYSPNTHDLCIHDLQYEYAPTQRDLFLYESSSMNSDIFLSYPNETDILCNWRLLTIQEWEHIIYNRNNANKLRGLAIVNTIHGYVLLPDDWSCPKGLSFVSIPNSWYKNIYSAQQWQQMEKQGAVFLPCAGYMDGNRCRYPEEFGYYWLQKHQNDITNFFFFGINFIDQSFIETTYPDARESVSMSLRLVRPKQ